MTNARHIPTLKSLTTLVAGVAAFGVLAAPAAAKPVPYVGKTSHGAKVTFKLDKGWIKSLTTALPATCASAQGGEPKALIHVFNPAFNFRVGGVAKATRTVFPKTYYTVDTKRSGKKITGKLDSSWSLLATSAWGGWKIDTCIATGTFTAKPR